LSHAGGNRNCRHSQDADPGGQTAIDGAAHGQHRHRSDRRGHREPDQDAFEGEREVGIRFLAVGY
jgi:hypothetical protein